MDSRNISEHQQSAEEIIITPTRTAVADLNQDGSHSPQADTPIRRLHLDTENDPLPPQNLSTPSRGTCCAVIDHDRHTTPPASLTHQVCDVCLANSSPRNRVLEYCGDNSDKFANLEISLDVYENGQFRTISFKPFSDAKQRASERSVFTCRHCERQLRIICFPRKKERKIVEKVKRYIWNRLESNRVSRSASVSEEPGTVVSKKCFLHTYTSFESSCVDPVRNLSCPLMLETRMKMGETWKVEKWVTEFSKKMGIGTSVTKEIVTHARSVKLCRLHYSAMRNTMLTIEADANCCSICGNNGDKRYAGEVPQFPYDELFAKKDLLAVVEDSLSVLTDNKMQPRDVKHICSPCRLLVLGRVSVRDMNLRQRNSENVGFDYGPTETVVLQCISYIRRQLWENKVMFVKLKEVHEMYLELVRTSGSHEIQQRAHRDIRTLGKYLQPPLAQTEIHLERGAKRVGSFFCTLRTFRDIASNAKKPKISNRVKTPEMDKRWNNEFAKFLKSKREEVDKGEWSIAEYIRAVPKEMWAYDVAVHISKSLAARYAAVAKVRDVNVEDEWP